MSTAPVQCPISLDCPPLCPQITVCGHVYSYPAIMQHLINHGGEQLRWVEGLQGAAAEVGGGAMCPAIMQQAPHKPWGGAAEVGGGATGGSS